MKVRLKFPITKRVALTAAVVMNHWLSGIVERNIYVPQEADDYPMGCYL